MSLVRRGALLKNERLKLYKRPSTWILMGVIVLMTLLNLLFTRIFVSSYENYNPTWQEQYNSQIEDFSRMLKDNPDDAFATMSLDTLKYLIENQIQPLDWRTDVVTEYYQLKYKLSSGDVTGKNSTGVNIDDDELNRRIEKLNTLLKNEDWKAFVNLKISDLKSGDTPSANELEKQVDIEMYELYIEQGIVPVAQGAYQYYHGGSSDVDKLTWKSELVRPIRENKLSLIRGENRSGELLTHTQRNSLEDSIEVALKRLSTNTPPVSYDSFLGLLETAATSLSILSILLIVYASNIFASEYSSGTIKLLLITPHKRNKIFWAKTLLMLELAAIALAANFVLAFLISGAFTGFEGIGSVQILPLFGNTVQLPYLLYIVLRYLLLMLPVLAYGAMAMMMSVVTRKGAVAIAVTLLVMYGSQIIMSVLVVLSGRIVLPGIKFLLFANTQLEYYLPSAQSVFNGSEFISLADSTMTLRFSIAVLIVYTVCFLWVARDSFCRRDVK